MPKRQTERWEECGATVRPGGRTSVSHWPVETASRAQAKQMDGPAPHKAAWCAVFWVVLTAVMAAQGWIPIILVVLFVFGALWSLKDELQHSRDAREAQAREEARANELAGQLSGKEQQLAQLRADFNRLADENSWLRADIDAERRQRTADARRPRAPLWGCN